MGVEHSLGHQTLCYVNAEHHEECFRSNFEQHNLFELSLDLLYKDSAAFIDGLQSYAKAHHGEIEEDHAAALEEYMSQHHSGEAHDIEALQWYLTEA